jgi:hypothetical protein
MQYLLTQQEFDELNDKARAVQVRHTEELQSVCTLVANHAPAHRPWAPKDKSPWLCIIGHRGHYCDCCPAKNICPYQFKEWSK